MVKCSSILATVWGLFLTACLGAGEPEGSGDELHVLDDAALPVPAEELLRDDLRRQTHVAFDRRQEAYEQLKTPEQCRDHQQRMKAFFVEQLGGFPERTPLRSRTVERLSRSGYSIEKIIYESRPGLHVTALLYLPEGKPPYPGVLMPCGHSSTGKAADAYQRACILLVRNGMAVLCFDPIGQGERKQLLDEQGHGRFGSTGEHMVTGVAPILLGRNLATTMVWDGMRGIDYLVSREDIDPQRIGCTGNSGGGNMTSFLMALDDRIVCAAPSCFITTHRRKNEHPGPGDAEQNIHAQIAFGMDHADFLLMRAPRPTLICAATQDYVPIEGAWEAYREAKRFYGRLGAPERVQLAEADAPHGFSPLLRQEAARWMRQWLLDRTEIIAEHEEERLLSPQEAWCTPAGQVLRLPEARTIFDLNQQIEAALRPERKARWHRDPQAALADVRHSAGVPEWEKIEPPTVTRIGHVDREGYRIDKLVLHPERGIPLPALWFVPADDADSGEVVLYCHGSGKHIDAQKGGPIEALVQNGRRVLAVDLRGCGETESPAWRYRSMAPILGHNSAEFFVAYMLGKSIVGLRTEDILSCAKYIRSEIKPQKLHLIGVGVNGVPALHAAALEPGRFEELTLRESLSSWRSVVEIPVTRQQLINVVHGALRVYDLPDLLRTLPTAKVTIEKPLDAAGQPLPDNHEPHLPARPSRGDLDR